MAGVYIPGMEMPTGDNHITLFLYPDRKVVVCGMLGPLGHYEAIPVPEHGRLGDLDELFKRMFVGPDGQCYPDKDVDGWDHAYTFRGIKHEILSAPTIIPADKEETT